MLDPISLIVGLAGLGLAAWGLRDGRKMMTLLRSLPRQMATQIALPSKVQMPEGGAAERPFDISYGDVDNDGKDELLIQYPAGAHGRALHVYGMRGWQFALIGNLGSGTPAGFTVEDFDGDGKMEVGTEAADFSLGLPYYLSPRLKVWYRWNGKDFDKVATVKAYTDADVEAARKELAKAQQR